MKTIYLLFLICIAAACDKEFTSLGKKEKTAKSLYYEDFPVTDSLGRRKNPVRIEIYFETSIPISGDLRVDMFKLSDDKLLESNTVDLNSGDFLLWHLFEENRETGEVYRELDTVAFRFEFEGLQPEVLLKLQARTHFDTSKVIYFKNEAQFRAIIPKMGTWKKPSDIIIEEI